MIGLMPGQATENRQYQGPPGLPGQLGPGIAYSQSTQGPDQLGLVSGLSTTRTSPGTLVPGWTDNQAKICCPGLALQHHQAQACPGALARLAWAPGWLAWALGCLVPPRPRPGPARALVLVFPVETTTKHRPADSRQPEDTGTRGFDKYKSQTCEHKNMQYAWAPKTSCK